MIYCVLKPKHIFETYTRQKYQANKHCMFGNIFAIFQQYDL